MKCAEPWGEEFAATLRKPPPNSKRYLTANGIEHIPLQKTKFFIPPARAQLIRRPRLIRRLDGLLAEGGRVGVISAPAGSGKTTLVVQWLARQENQAAWLSLDARDNVPTPGTLLRGKLRDQAALFGLLARVRDLNLTLLEVRRIEEM